GHRDALDDGGVGTGETGETMHTSAALPDQGDGDFRGAAVEPIEPPECGSRPVGCHGSATGPKHPGHDVLMPGPPERGDPVHAGLRPLQLPVLHPPPDLAGAESRTDSLVTRKDAMLAPSKGGEQSSGGFFAPGATHSPQFSRDL